MEFTLTNVCFCGFCGDKAVISQNKQARLFNYFNDLSFILMDKLAVEVSLLCIIDHNNTIWIKKVIY